MYLQVLSFHLTATDREKASRFCERAVLGLAEFDGFVTDSCLTKPRPHSHRRMVAWSDWASLESFRHSELYAKLRMNPLFEEVTDRAFYVDEAATTEGRLSELLAVA